MASPTADSQATQILLDRLETGDSTAFEELMSRHLGDIKQSVRRRLRPQLRPRLDESDVIQETQQDAFRRMPDYLRRRPMPFRLWLLRTAHERLVDIERFHLRAAKRSANRELPLPDESSVQLADRFLNGRPVDHAMRRELASKVRRGLAELSETDREVLMLRCFEGLDNRDVASLLEVNPETTKKRFSRAIVHLEQVLRRLGVTESQS